MIQAEQIQKDLVEMRMRKEQAVQGFNQILGAITVLEQLLVKAEAGEPVEEVPPTEPVENTNGEANEQAEEQAA